MSRAAQCLWMATAWAIGALFAFALIDWLGGNPSPSQFFGMWWGAVCAYTCVKYEWIS